MTLNGSMDRIMVSLSTAILLAMGGLIWTTASGFATDDDLNDEVMARMAADTELKQAQTELAKQVTEYILSQERRFGTVDKLLEQLEKHMEGEKHE